MTLDLRAAQRRLSLIVDGVLGPKTWAALFAHAGARPDLARPMGAAMAEFGRDIDQPLEIAHFLAQTGHETLSFRYFTELGGPTYCAKYDGRSDLGNCEPGDGWRFKGRGIVQLTGRANYAEMSRKLGVDLLSVPDRAADPDIAVRTALEFWRSRGLGPLAMADDLAGVTKRVNGGKNGIEDRRRRLVALKALFAA